MVWHALKQIYVIKIFGATNQKNQCFMYMSPFVEYCLIMKELKLLLKDISKFWALNLFVGSKNFDLLKQSKVWSNCSSLMQCNGKTQRLARARRNTTDSATKEDHTFHTHFFVNPYCGIFGTGLTRHWVTFVKLPFSYKKHDVTIATYEVFPFNYNGNAKKMCLELLSNRVKMPTSLKILNCLKIFRKPTKKILNYAVL